MQTTTDPRLLTAEHPLSNPDLAIVTLGRLALNVAYRILYPLLPFLSGRLAVDVQMVSWLITVQVIAGLISPLGGLISDSHGPRATMALGNGAFCVGALVCALSVSFAGFFVGYALIGLATALYMPGAQAYLSVRTPYARRGRALGIFEMGWALSAIVGVAPLMLVVERTRTTAPVFWVLLGVSLATLALLRLLPQTVQAPRHERTGLNWSSLRMPRVLGLLGLCVLAICGIDLIFVVQAPWLKANFGATETQLGQVFALMGVAEFAGSIGSTLLVDHMGKKRSVVGGYTLTALCAAALAFSGGSWLTVLALLFLFDMCFEFAIVSTFPLASGIAPAARATVLALAVAAIGVGRAVSSQIGNPIWINYGIIANGLLSAALIGAGVVLCALFVQETEQHPS